MVDGSLEQDRSLVVESTLSGRSFGRVIQLARQRGFTVTIVFLFLDSVDTCVARVKERKRKGGHGVPEIDIRRRFDRSIRNFWMTYRFLVNDWALMYNAGSNFQDVAFGAGEVVSVRDETFFSRFIRMVEQIEA